MSLAVGITTSDLRAQEYTMEEIVDTGHRFFGATSGGLASAIEKIFAAYGLPTHLRITIGTEAEVKAVRTSLAKFVGRT